LNISLTVQGESFYQERMKLLMNDSTVNKHIKIDQGMKIMFIENNKTPLILQKSDSAFTYDTSDLAAIKYRLDEEKVDQIIYVVDSSQSLHFELLFKTAINLKWITGANQLKHVGFGLILGEDGKKLKSRSGHSVKLQDVIDEVYEYAYETMKKKIQSGDKHHLTEPEIKTVSKKIAINSIKYFDLHNPRLNSYKFDIKNMLSQKGDTALYLMYTLGRCKGINRKIKILDPDNIFSENLDSKIITTNSQARRLILKLLQFQEPIIDSINQLSPHHLCTYLYDLTQLLTSFYETVICIETVNDKIHIYNDRVKLINMSINMIEKYFDLLGLESVEEL
jgi:arginyl-tRNA synthetase